MSQLSRVTCTNVLWPPFNQRQKFKMLKMVRKCRKMDFAHVISADECRRRDFDQMSSPNARSPPTIVVQFEYVIGTVEQESYSGQSSMILYYRTISDRTWWEDRFPGLLHISKHFQAQNIVRHG